MTIFSKNAIFRPKTELEAIARQSVDASCEVDCAYFGNIGINSGYFLLPIFLGSYLNVHPEQQEVSPGSNCHCAPAESISRDFTQYFRGDK